jgi:CRP-like cAMP-binding protein
VTRAVLAESNKVADCYKEVAMISPELIRRYPFFGGLSPEQMMALAKVADIAWVESGDYFFHEGDKLEKLYLVLNGHVSIVIEVPAQNAKQTISGQLTRQLQTKDVIVSDVGPGQVFAWSALIPPQLATSGAKATTRCQVVAFDCTELIQLFEEDCRFGYLMMQKAAQVSRDRLHDLHIESLARYINGSTS